MTVGRRRSAWALGAAVLLSAPVAAQRIGPEAYSARRTRVMAELADGVLLLHAASSPKTMEQWGFVQDPSFLYFSGLPDLPGAILALDGPNRAAILFVPPAPLSFGVPLRDLVPEPGPASARAMGVDSVLSWDRFAGWVEGRLARGVTLYLDEPRRSPPAGVPEGFAPVAGEHRLWQATLEARYPRARIASAKAAIQALRWVKSPEEVEVLRRNARATAAALLAAARSIRPGRSQRSAEVAVVAACIEAGAEGPSFWPWVMAGPNTRMERLAESFFRYGHQNRAMREGELVRVDIGCAGGLYGADVGRTVPVSGRFTAGQKEAWELLVGGYRAGLRAMGPGVSVSAVRRAAAAEVERRRAGLATPLGRAAAAAILAAGDATWHLHGVGIESGEDAGPVLQAGSVLAFEPGVAVGDDGFYLEDMIVITAAGHEVLSAGLPYLADEIEAAMRGRGATR